LNDDDERHDIGFDDSVHCLSPSKAGMDYQIHHGLIIAAKFFGLSLIGWIGGEFGRNELSR